MAEWVLFKNSSSNYGGVFLRKQALLMSGLAFFEHRKDGGKCM